MFKSMLKRFVRGTRGTSEVVAVMVLIAISLLIASNLQSSGTSAASTVGGNLQKFVK